MAQEKGSSISRRDKWIDIARGIGIILVILGHAIREEMQTDYIVFYYTYRVLYMFHMNLFFFLAGITYTRYNRENHLGIFLKNKTKKLLIPWISYSLLIYLLFALASFISPIKGILIGGLGGGGGIKGYHL